MHKTLAGLPPSTVKAEPNYTVPEIAAYLRVEQSMVYRMVREGRLPHVRVGRLVRVTQSQLEEFLAGGAA